MFLPILLFIDLYSTDLRSVFNPKLVIYAGCSVLAAFFLSLVLCASQKKTIKSEAPWFRAFSAAIFIIFGIPHRPAPFTGDNRG